MKIKITETIRNNISSSDILAAVPNLLSASLYLINFKILKILKILNALTNLKSINPVK